MTTLQILDFLIHCFKLHIASNLVDRGGIEPPNTPCHGVSFPLAYRPKYGAPGGNRTPGPFVRSEVLCPLSYGRKFMTALYH